MKKPVLIIMAAGMGSRYGGLKQIDPIDNEGHIIIDFSIYDAIKAGFEKLVFFIKEVDEQDFKDVIGERISKKIPVEYVYQELYKLHFSGNDLPSRSYRPYPQKLLYLYPRLSGLSAIHSSQMSRRYFLARTA